MMSELNDDVITSDISNDVIDLSNDISNDVTDTSDVTKDVPKNVPSDVSPDRGKRPLPDADSDSTLPQGKLILGSEVRYLKSYQSYAKVLTDCRFPPICRVVSGSPSRW
jgi:hypothetical protein